MNRARSNSLLCRVVAALSLLGAPFVAVDRAEAMCSPASPVSNAAVDCTGATLNGSGNAGHGSQIDNNNTITVQPGATVTGDLIGLLFASGTVINNGVVTGGSPIDGGPGIFAEGGAATVTNNSSGVISGGSVGILGGIINLTNSGTIEATGTTANNEFGILAQLGAATINNLSGGIIRANGNGGVAIRGPTVTVTGNDGTIVATGANGRAIDADTGDANVTNNGGVIQANIAFGVAIAATGTARVDNGTGTISGGIAGILAPTVNVTANAGTIEAISVSGAAVSAADATVNNTGGTIQATEQGGIAIAGSNTAVVNNVGGIIRAIEAGGFAIQTGLNGTATLSNTNDGAATGVITGDTSAISAGTVHVTANAGTIQAVGVNGIAIKADNVAIDGNSGSIRTVNVNNDSASAISGKNVTVTGNAGRIEATGANSAAIQASTTLNVNNLSGGVITGGGVGIFFANPASTAVVTNAAGGTISGGAAGLEIRGSGTVRNAGTISGATNSVDFNSAGSTNTLILQTGSVLIGDAVGNATSTNKLILEGSGTANNNFAGFTSLDMASGNHWVLNGNSGVGAATISGILEVGDGAHASANLIGNVAVNTGGQLTGQGIISGNVNVMSGGLLAPGAVAGTAIGTLTVTGNAAFAANSTFSVSANAAGQASKLAVGGTATLTDARVQVLAGGSFAPSSSTPYTILTTTNVNGLGGTRFASVTTNLAFLTPSLSYTANDVTLTLATAAGGTGDPGGGDPGGGGTGGGTTGGGTASTGFGFVGVAQTRNQRAVATALDRGPVTNSLIIAVLNQTVAGARQAFDALSGEVFGSVHNAQGQEAQFARSAMLGRMRQGSYAGIPGDLGALGFGGPALAYAAGDTSSADSVGAAYATKVPPGAQGPSRDLTFWAQGLGGWGHVDSDGNAASLRSRFGGFLSGVDARFGETWRAGFVAGFMRSDLNVDARASSAGIDSVQLGGYASGRVGAFNVRGGASYSLDSIDTSRAIVFPGFTDKTSARFHGNVGQVFGEIGYGMAFGSVAVEPLAGLAYVHVRDGSFLESGGVAALSGASARENTGYSFLGVRAATFVPLANGTMLIPRGTLQWQHAFGDVTPTAALAFQGTGAAFSVAGIPIARDAALVEGGFDWRFAPQAKLGAFYQGELAAHAQTHAVKGAFTWDF